MSLKEFIYFNKKKIILLVLCLTVGGCSLWFYYKDDTSSKTKEKESVLEEKLIVKEEEKEDDVSFCFFDIKGEVVNPGVYSIECDKRLVDAINVAGGLTKNSDTSVLNLSKKIEDGMFIRIYSAKEVSNYLETLEQESKKETICSSSNIVNDACNSSSGSLSSSNGLVNINTATLDELMSLTGIGESKAKNIIAYREKTLFKSVEDILNVA